MTWLPSVSFTLALVGVLLPIVGALGAQLGQVRPLTGFLLALTGAGSGLLSGGLAVVYLAARGGDRRVWFAVLVAVTTFVVVVSLVVSRSRAPRINDITTSLDDPVRLVDVRGNPRPFPEATRAEHAAGYPDLTTLQVNARRDDVYSMIQNLVFVYGWELQWESAADGWLQAMATTSAFRFEDDIAFRVVGAGGGVVAVDVRSRSRVGRGDLGTNARRIREFLAAVELGLR